MLAIAMRVAMLPQLNSDPPPPHLVRHRRRRAGAEEGVEHEVAGVCGEVDTNVNEFLGFLSVGEPHSALPGHIVPI